MDERQRLGKRGEELAERHLAAKGYNILETNYRTRMGEIDLIAERHGVLVFVEVKARRGNALDSPEESITPGKRSHLVAAAQEYLQAADAGDVDWRIDLVALELDRRGRLIRLRVTENAVEG